MPRTTIARVDLDALRHNYTLACQRAGTARAMAVVKADGYGHGIREVAGPWPIWRPSTPWPAWKKPWPSGMRA